MVHDLETIQWLNARARLRAEAEAERLVAEAASVRRAELLAELAELDELEG